MTRLCISSTCKLDFDQGELLDHRKHVLGSPKTRLMIDVTKGHFKRVDSREQADTFNNNHSLQAACT